MYDETRQHIKKHQCYFASKGPSSQSFGFSNSYVLMWDLDHKESSSVQFSCSVVSDSSRPRESQHARPPCLSPSPGVHSDSHLLSRWSSHLILCHPLLLLPPNPPSIRVFSNESTPCVSWPKYWSFSFNISSSNEHRGLISFRMDWLNLLALQRTLKSLLQHHSSKASVFSTQLSLWSKSYIHTWLLEKP